MQPQPLVQKDVHLAPDQDALVRIFKSKLNQLLLSVEGLRSKSGKESRIVLQMNLSETMTAEQSVTSLRLYVDVLSDRNEERET